GVPSHAVECQRILPLSRSMHRTLNVCFLSAPTLSGCRNSLSPSSTCFTAFAPGTTAPSTAVVRKTRLPQTIGDECERPSMAVFHLMFLVGLHSDGRFFSFEIPVPSGPRHCGQFPADAVVAKELRPAAVKVIPAISASAIRCVCFTVSSSSDPCYPWLASLRRRTSLKLCAQSTFRPRSRAWPSSLRPPDSLRAFRTSVRPSRRTRLRLRSRDKSFLPTQ